MTAKSGDTVAVHYTGKLESGEIFDSSEGKDPLKFTLGAGQMIPGFDKGVHGMEVDESKTIHIPAADAYGEHRAEMVQPVPKSQLPADMEPEPGMRLYSQLPTGEQIPLLVTEVNDDHIVVDANHQLAGKDLIFDVKLVSVG